MDTLSLTALFFEDAVEDSIQVETDQSNEFEGAGYGRFCSDSNEIDGGDVDGEVLDSSCNRQIMLLLTYACSKRLISTPYVQHRILI